MAKQKGERYPGEFDEYDRLVSPAGVAVGMLGGVSGDERVTLEIKLSEDEVLKIGLPAKNARLIASAMIAEADAIDAQQSRALRA